MKNKAPLILACLFCIFWSGLISQNKQITFPPNDTIIMVSATINDDETACLVEWFIHDPVMELSYDDGSAENMVIWNIPQSMNAVKFTPPFYPATITGGKVFIGEDFPPGGQVIGSTFGMAVFDDDGLNGLPGTQLDSIEVTVNNWRWVSFTGLSTTIQEGNFYLAMIQGSEPPNTAGIGIDEELPTWFRSYAKPFGQNWMIAAWQDMMIRATVSLANNSGDLLHPIDYQSSGLTFIVSIFSNFDPDSTNPGDETILATTQWTTYCDTSYGSLDCGWYRYGIRYFTPDGDTSDYGFSGTISRCMNSNITVRLMAENGNNAGAATIAYKGYEYPYDSSSTACFVNDSVQIEMYKGTCQIQVSHPGFNTITIDSLPIDQDSTITLHLTTLPPSNLWVDPLTGIAYWNSPQGGALSYHLFLDGEYIGPSRDTTYNLGYLTYGQEYSLGVSAYYQLQLSDTIYYAFMSEYLLPVRNLRCGNVGIIWDPPFYNPAQGQKKDTGNGYTNQTDAMSGIHAESSTVKDHYLYDFTTDSIPSNLLRYNIYLFGDSICTVDPPINVYYDFDLWPGIYEYAVSAVYDISPYGYSGEAESMVAGPVYCLVSYGDTLPFQEDWISGSFETNQWSVDCDNWTINLQEGNPAPCAEFSGVGPLTYYRCSLYSYFMKGTDYPNNDIWLDFDLKLNDIISTGNESLEISVWENGTFQTIDEFTNTGSFDWTHKTMEITTYAAGNDFLIAFIAGGYSSENINGWLIDNIEVYTTAKQTLTPGISSKHPGNDCISLIPASTGFELPFLEDWTLGNFQINQWDHSSCDNWEINGQQGNPAPSAEFAWDPPKSNYSCPLISNTLLGTNIIDGNIWMDFDIKLHDRNENETESFTVSLIRNDSLFDLTQYTNKGNMEWTSEHLDITDLAKGFEFKIAFIPHGESSVNIHGWFLDNIHVYQSCRPPIDFNAALIWEPNPYMELSWIAPYDTLGEWIMYNDGSLENAFASTNGGYGLAQLFDLDDFPQVEYPFTITEVRYFNDNYENYQQEEAIYVLSGNGATVLAGPYYMENQPANEWVTVPVDDVEITEGNFMIATINSLPGGPYIGVDDSYYNATLYFGTIGDWTELSELGAYYYVGSHEAYIITETDRICLNSTNNNINRQKNIASHIPISVQLGNQRDNSRNLLGYNIYRSFDYCDFEIINDSLIPESPYYDFELFMNGYYSYYAIAVYNQCSSPPSDTSGTYFITQIPETTRNSSINIFPNPANDYLMVESNRLIDGIQVIGKSGNLIIHKTGINNSKARVGLENLKDGIYIVMVQTEKEITNKKFIVIK